MNHSGRTARALASISISILLLSAGRALPYGVEGHKAIAEAARSQLTPEARQAVIKILGNDDLAPVSIWADQLRQKELPPDVTDDLNRRFPNHREWHFVNLPLGSTHYYDTSPFSTENDVVHAINRCIAALESPDQSGSGMSHQVALKFLIHLVGDIHQPLHVACGYYRINPVGELTLIRNPGTAVGLPNDLGGNRLYMGRAENLHSFWDTGLTETAANSIDYTVLARLLSTLGPTIAWQTDGDYHTWAETWAGESAAVANQAYDGITFSRTTRPRPREINPTPINFDGGLEAYRAAQQERATTQLAKAAARLAALLNKIDWK